MTSFDIARFKVKPTDEDKALFAEVTAIFEREDFVNRGVIDNPEDRAKASKAARRLAELIREAEDD